MEQKQRVMDSGYENGAIHHYTNVVTMKQRKSGIIKGMSGTVRKVDKLKAICVLSAYFFKKLPIYLSLNSTKAQS